MTTKTCTKCGVEKPTTMFSKHTAAKSGLRSQCKECDKNHRTSRSKRYYEANKDRIKKRSYEWYCANKDRALANAKQSREKNKDKIRERHKEYWRKNKDKLTTKNKKYREDNRQRILESRRLRCAQRRDHYNQKAKEWKEANKERVAETRRRYDHEKKKHPLFRLKHNIRANIYQAFKSSNYRKKSRTEEILGCDFETLKYHLEISFIENYGCAPDWENDILHIDHIIPISLASTEEDVIRLNHFTNLQLLLPSDNIKKSNKLEWAI